MKSLYFQNTSFVVCKESTNKRKETNDRVLLADLKSCGITRNLQRGREIHAELMESGRDPSRHLAAALVNMYAKCGQMVQAHQVFDGIGEPDVVSWNALLMGYAGNGEGFTALDLFSKMKSRNSLSYTAALKACASLAVRKNGSGKAKCLERGRQIHSEIGCHMNLYVQTSLVDMYAKCGSMVEARSVFESINHPSVVSWAVLLLGYVDSGEELIALDLFSKMKSEGVTPNSVTYVAAIKACSSLAVKHDSCGILERGKQIHSEIGCHLDLHARSALVDMYAKCGRMVDARQVFDNIKQPDVVSWNALLLGYAENGEGVKALGLFSKMKSQGCAPNSRTYVAALKACASLALRQDSRGRLKCLKHGKQIHAEVGRHLDLHLQTTLIDMYGKCGSMADAHQVFDSIRQPNLVSWTVLLLGYVDSGEGLLALDLFSRMKSQGVAPDSLAYVAALKACAVLGSPELGRTIHAEISVFNAAIVTTLVDLFAKCGNMVEAQEVFDLHAKTRDVTTWTALLAGYSSFGQSNSVFKLFERMQDAGVQPNSVTFQCILMCCSHGGLVEKAKECFEAMPSKYSVTPTVEHYNCMLDVFGRANKLDDALMLLQGIPCSSDVVTWLTVLGFCRKWKNVEIGKLAFQSLITLDETNAAAYVQMAHIYRSRGMSAEEEVVLCMSKYSVEQISALESW